MESGFTFQPKPEGNHYVAVHLCYRLITDGTASTAALLNCFEFLARSTLANSGWTPDQPIPDDIPIAGDCNNPLLMRLMDGLVKQTALKNKIGLLAEKGFISCDIMGGRRRKVVYHYRRIQNAISDPSLFDGSLSDGSKSDGYPSKSDDN